MAIAGYSVVHVVSASRAEEREKLGERLTDWLAEHPQLEVVEFVVLQTSDASRHCHSIFAFLKERT